MLESQKKKVKNRKRTHNKVKENSTVKSTSQRHSDMNRSPISNAEDPNSFGSEHKEGISLRNGNTPSKRSDANFAKAAPKTSDSRAHFLGQSTASEAESASGKAGECTRIESSLDEKDSGLVADDAEKNALESVLADPNSVDVDLREDTERNSSENCPQQAENIANQDSSSSSDNGDSHPETTEQVSVKYQFDSGFVSESNDFQSVFVTAQNAVIVPVPVMDSYSSSQLPISAKEDESAPPLEESCQLFDEDSDQPDSLPTLDSINDLHEDSGVLLSHMKETLKAITEKIPVTGPEFLIKRSLLPEGHFIDSARSHLEGWPRSDEDQEDGPPRLLDPHGISISQPESPHHHSESSPTDLEDLSEDQPWLQDSFDHQQHLEQNQEFSDHQPSLEHNQVFPNYQPALIGYQGLSSGHLWSQDFSESNLERSQDHEATLLGCRGLSDGQTWGKEDSSEEEEVDVEALYPSTLKLKWTSDNNLKIASAAERQPSPPSEHSKVILRIKRTFSGVIYSSTDPFGKTQTKKCDSKPVKSFSRSSSCRYKKKKSKHKKRCRHHRKSDDRHHRVKVLKRNSPNSYEVKSEYSNEEDFSDYLKRVGEVKYKRIKLKYGLNNSLNIDIPPTKHKKVS